MRFRQSLLPVFITLSLWSSSAFGDNENQNPGFTLQIAAFPEAAESDAESFVAKLVEAGEQPVWGLVEIPGKGQWLRVYLGSFKSAAAARQYGERLLSRRLIKEFIIKKSSEMKILSRPRSVIRKAAGAPQLGGAVSGNEASLSAILYLEKPILKINDTKINDTKPPLPSARRPAVKGKTQVAAIANRQTLRPVGYATLQAVSTAHEHSYGNFFNSNIATLSTAHPSARLPQFHPAKWAAIQFAPALDGRSIPRPDPLQSAFQILAHRASPAARGGGLWVSGDRLEGLERLRWIVGKEFAEALSLDEEGKVQLNEPRLLAAAKLKEVEPVLAPLVMLETITANEGLLLVVQLTQGNFRYRLHLGQKVATGGDEVVVTGSMNLDNNFDSRINPYRRAFKKLEVEKPPCGFDSLIAINPEARWFNLRTNRLVQVGNITFHELAEAYAKVELGYEYLPKEARPGAHNSAIEREVRLQAQRPFADLVLTLGSNRVLRTEEEWRQFYAESPGARQE
ncbi:MAG: SPOR domain-containing protein [Acidobacteria bacterium]|nr:SPOR domain-containing protein [Acidobacteriota bacterium]